MDTQLKNILKLDIMKTWFGTSHGLDTSEIESRNNSMEWKHDTEKKNWIGPHKKQKGLFGHMGASFQ